MAIWVAIAHTYSTFGYGIAEPLNRLINVAYAVDVFIILSGFVIFLLLDKQRQTYTSFIVRRGFRLFPVYLITLIFSAATLEWQIDTWMLFENSGGYWEGRLKTMQDSLEYFNVQILTHIPLLQGVFGKIIPSSDFAFIEPAWSLSLEWQFYLAAPFIFVALTNHRKKLHLVLIALFMSVTYGQLGSGFLPNQFYFFVVGIASYFIFDRMSGANRLQAAIAILCVGLMLRSIPITIWGAFFVLALTEQVYLLMLKNILTNKVFTYLGKISYPIYVIHTLMIYPAYFIVSYFRPLIHCEVNVAIIITTLIMTVFMSHLLHLWVEQPAISFGRRLRIS